MQNELVSLLSSLIKMIKIIINSTKSVVCPFSEIWAGAFQVSSNEECASCRKTEAWVGGGHRVQDFLTC